MSGIIGGLLVILYLLGLYAWMQHCLFFWHKWESRGQVTDVCTRCGAIRFKR